MKTIKIICRQSPLSLLQAEIVKQKIKIAQPEAIMEIIGHSSRGDRELSVPLSSLDGSDFFTEEIVEALKKGKADIAVHSLKDMSAHHFFSHDAFAVPERNDVRDIAIFNPAILEKIKAGKTIVAGTCSPRREDMVIDFLKKALPQVHKEIKIKTKSIRGNVEQRLQQLHEEHYDFTILATAGLNRLLSSEDTKVSISALLKNKKVMLLPLTECVPAPCQGAIVAEAYPGNAEAVALLKKINDEELFREVYNEKKEAYKYGSGCLQRFGVVTIKTNHGNFLYAAGKTIESRSFSSWNGLPALEINPDTLFSTTDFLGNFFKYEFFDPFLIVHKPLVYVANYKAIHHPGIIKAIEEKKIWAAGTKTWLELAKSGIWVEGCADSFGLEFLQPVLSGPLFKFNQADIHILTNDHGAKHWAKKNWRATPTYLLEKKENKQLENKIKKASAIFWTSIHQYFQYKNILPDTIVHLSASGETASLLKAEGIDPVIFSTIKAFEQWRKSLFMPLSAV